MLSPRECLALVERLNAKRADTRGGSSDRDVEDISEITQYLTALNDALERAIKEQKSRGVSEVSVPLPPLTGKILSGVLMSPAPPQSTRARAPHNEMASAMFRVCATLSQVPALRGWASCVFSEVTRPVRQSPRIFQDDPVGAAFVDGLLLRQEPPLKRMSFLQPPDPAPAPAPAPAPELPKSPAGADTASNTGESPLPNEDDEGMMCLCDESPDSCLTPALSSMSGQFIYESVARAIMQRAVDSPDTSRALLQLEKRLAESPALWAQFLEAARYCCVEAAPAVTSQLSPLVVAARVLTEGVRRRFAEDGRPDAFCGLFGPRHRSLVRTLAAMPRFATRDACVPAFRSRWLRDVERICAEFLEPGHYSPELWFVVVVLFGAWASFAFNALRYLVCAAAPVPRFLSRFVAWTLVPPRVHAGQEDGDITLLRTELGSFLTSCTLDPTLVLRMEFLPAPFRRYWALVDCSVRCALLTEKGLQSEEELPPGCADPIFLGFEVGNASEIMCCENHKTFARTLFMTV